MELSLVCKLSGAVGLGCQVAVLSSSPAAPLLHQACLGQGARMRLCPGLPIHCPLRERDSESPPAAQQSQEPRDLKSELWCGCDPHAGPRPMTLAGSPQNTGCPQGAAQKEEHEMPSKGRHHCEWVGLAPQDLEIIVQSKEHF